MGQATDLYSQLKPAWHEAHLAALRKGQTPTPVHVQLILANLCNQRCAFCAYRLDTGLTRERFNEQTVMPADRAREVLDDCATLNVRAIQFTGGGEPTVHPNHLELFARAQSLGMETALVTNGVLLRAEHEAVRRMAWVRVSIDAGVPEAYTAVRQCPPSHWHKAWAAVRTLGRASDYAGVLGVGFVVTPQNYYSLPAAARLARDAGAHYIRIGAVFSSEGLAYYGSTIPAIHETIELTKRDVSGSGFDVVDMFGRRLSDLEAGAPTDPTCYYQYLTVYIGADLGVYRCCNTAFTERGFLGRITEHRRLASLDLQYAPFDATRCRFCQFLGQNAVLKALVQQPRHVNFV